MCDCVSFTSTRTCSQTFSALEGLAQLEELTATNNLISSIEPLRRLAHRGRLRKATLDDNCVTSCEGLGGAELSCADSWSSCEPLEERAPAGALSVPFDSIEQHAPDIDLPVWTQAQVERAFEMLMQSTDDRL